MHWLVVRFTPVGDALDVLGDDSPWAAPFLAADRGGRHASRSWRGCSPRRSSSSSWTGRRPPAWFRWWMPKAALATFLTSLVLVLAFGVGRSLLLLLPVGRADRQPLARRAGRVRRQVVPARAGLIAVPRCCVGTGCAPIGLVITLGLVLTVPSVVGALLLVLTGVSFAAASVVVTLCAVVLVPYVALVLAHFYAELAESGTRRGARRPARRRRRPGWGSRGRGRWRGRGVMR